MLYGLTTTTSCITPQGTQPQSTEYRIISCGHPAPQWVHPEHVFYN